MPYAFGFCRALGDTFLSTAVAYCILLFIYCPQVDLCWKHRIFAIIEGAFDPQKQVWYCLVWYGTDATAVCTILRFFA